MGAYSVVCPRCEGDRVVRVKTPVERHRPFDEYRFETVDCPLCSGTGRASLLEKMAVPRKQPAHEDV